MAFLIFAKLSTAKQLCVQRETQIETNAENRKTGTFRTLSQCS